MRFQGSTEEYLRAGGGTGWKLTKPRTSTEPFIQEIEPSQETDPIKRMALDEQREIRESRRGFWGGIFEAFGRSQAAAPALIHKTYLERVAQGYAPGLTTGIGATLETLAGTPVGLAAGALVGLSVGGPVGLAIGGAGALLNVGSLLYDPKKYGENLGYMWKGYSGRIRAGEKPIDSVALLQEMGVPTGPAWAVGLLADIVNPTDWLNWIGVGLFEHAARDIPIVVGKVATTVGFGRRAVGELGVEAARFVTEGSEIAHVGELAAEATARLKTGGYRVTARLSEAGHAAYVERVNETLGTLLKQLDESRGIHGDLGSRLAFTMDRIAGESNPAAQLDHLNEIAAEIRRFLSPIPGVEQLSPFGKSVQEFQDTILSATDLYETATKAGARTLKEVETTLAAQHAAGTLASEAFGEFKNAAKWLDDPLGTFEHIISEGASPAVRDGVRFGYQTLIPTISKRFPYILKPVEIGIGPTLRGGLMSRGPLKWVPWRAAMYGTVGGTIGFMDVDPEDTPFEALTKVLGGAAAGGFLGLRPLMRLSRAAGKAYVAARLGRELPEATKIEIEQGFLRHFGAKAARQIVHGTGVVVGSVYSVLGRQVGRTFGFPFTASPLHWELRNAARSMVKMLWASDEQMRGVGYAFSRQLEEVVKEAEKQGREIEDAQTLLDVMNSIIEGRTHNGGVGQTVRDIFAEQERRGRPRPAPETPPETPKPTETPPTETPPSEAGARPEGATPETPEGELPPETPPPATPAKPSTGEAEAEPPKGVDETPPPVHPDDDPELEKQLEKELGRDAEKDAQDVEDVAQPSERDKDHAGAGAHQDDEDSVTPRPEEPPTEPRPETVREPERAPEEAPPRETPPEKPTAPGDEPRAPETPETVREPEAPREPSPERPPSETPAPPLKPEIPPPEHAGFDLAHTNALLDDVVSYSPREPFDRVVQALRDVMAHDVGSFRNRAPIHLMQGFDSPEAWQELIDEILSHPLEPAQVDLGKAMIASIEGQSGWWRDTVQQALRQVEWRRALRGLAGSLQTEETPYPFVAGFLNRISQLRLGVAELPPESLRRLAGLSADDWALVGKFTEGNDFPGLSDSLRTAENQIAQGNMTEQGVRIDAAVDNVRNSLLREDDAAFLEDMRALMEKRAPTTKKGAAGGGRKSLPPEGAAEGALGEPRAVEGEGATGGGAGETDGGRVRTDGRGAAGDDGEGGISTPKPEGFTPRFGPDRQPTGDGSGGGAVKQFVDGAGKPVEYDDYVADLTKRNGSEIVPLAHQVHNVEVAAHRFGQPDIEVTLPVGPGISFPMSAVTNPKGSRLRAMRDRTLKAWVLRRTRKNGAEIRGLSMIQPGFIKPRNERYVLRMKPGMLIADDTGTGKSYSAMMIIDALKKHGLEGAAEPDAFVLVLLPSGKNKQLTEQWITGTGKKPGNIPLFGYKHRYLTRSSFYDSAKITDWTQEIDLVGLSKEMNELVEKAYRLATLRRMRTDTAFDWALSAWMGEHPRRVNHGVDPNVSMWMQGSDPNTVFGVKIEMKNAKTARMASETMRIPGQHGDVITVKVEKRVYRPFVPDRNTIYVMEEGEYGQIFNQMPGSGIEGFEPDLLVADEAHHMRTFGDYLGSRNQFYTGSRKNINGMESAGKYEGMATAKRTLLLTATPGTAFQDIAYYEFLDGNYLDTFARAVDDPNLQYNVFNMQTPSGVHTGLWDEYARGMRDSLVKSGGMTSAAFRAADVDVIPMRVAGKTGKLADMKFQKEEEALGHAEKWIAENQAENPDVLFEAVVDRPFLWDKENGYELADFYNASVISYKPRLFNAKGEPIFLYSQNVHWKNTEGFVNFQKRMGELKSEYEGIVEAYKRAHRVHGYDGAIPGTDKASISQMAQIVTDQAREAQKTEFLIQAKDPQEMSLPLIQSLLRKNRKVIVYYEFAKGTDAAALLASKGLKAETATHYGGEPSPYLQFLNEIRDVNIPNGGEMLEQWLKANVPEARVVVHNSKRENVKGVLAFQEDGATTPNVLITTVGMSSQGVDLHDVVGTRPRVTFVLGGASDATRYKQTAGRSFRTGSQSSSLLMYVWNHPDELYLSRKLQRALRTMGAITPAEVESLRQINALKRASEGGQIGPQESINAALEEFRRRWEMLTQEGRWTQNQTPLATPPSVADNPIESVPEPSAKPAPAITPPKAEPTPEPAVETLTPEPAPSVTAPPAEAVPPVLPKTIADVDPALTDGFNGQLETLMSSGEPFDLGTLMRDSDPMKELSPEDAGILRDYLTKRLDHLIASGDAVKVGEGAGYQSTPAYRERRAPAGQTPSPTPIPEPVAEAAPETPRVVSPKNYNADFSPLKTTQKSDPGLRAEEARGNLYYDGENVVVTHDKIAKKMMVSSTTRGMIAEFDDVRTAIDHAIWLDASSQVPFALPKHISTRPRENIAVIPGVLSLDGREDILDIRDLVPSHGRLTEDGALSLADNIAYPHSVASGNVLENINTRKYDVDTAFQAELEQNFAQAPGSPNAFDVNVPLAVGPSVNTGPPIVTRVFGRYVVIGGNGRLIRLLKMYAAETNPVFREAYKARLLELMGAHGFDEKAVVALSNKEMPVLVRVVNQPEDVGQLKEIVGKLNISEARGTPEFRQMGTVLAGMTRENLARLSTAIGELPEESLLQTVLQTPGAKTTTIVQLSKELGIVEAPEYGRFFVQKRGTEVFTPEGASRLQALMDSLIFQDEEVLSLLRNEPLLSRGLTRGMPSIFAMRELDPALQTDLREALVAYRDYAGSGLTFPQWMAQPTLLGTHPYEALTERQRTLLQFIERNRSAVRRLGNGFDGYERLWKERDRVRATPQMFPVGEVSDGELFRKAFVDEVSRGASEPTEGRARQTLKELVTGGEPSGGSPGPQARKVVELPGGSENIAYRDVADRLSMGIGFTLDDVVYAVTKEVALSNSQKAALKKYVVERLNPLLEEGDVSLVRGRYTATDSYIEKYTVKPKPLGSPEVPAQALDATSSGQKIPFATEPPAGWGNVEGNVARSQRSAGRAGVSEGDASRSFGGTNRQEYLRSLHQVARGREMNLTPEQVDDFMRIQDAFAYSYNREFPERYPSLDAYYRDQIVELSTGTVWDKSGLRHGAVSVNPETGEPLGFTFYPHTNLAVMLHEQSHWISNGFSAEDIRDLREVYYPNLDDLTADLKARGVSDETIDAMAQTLGSRDRLVVHTEPFARDGERFIVEGKAPNERLRPAFKRIKNLVKTQLEELGHGDGTLAERAREQLKKWYGEEAERMIPVREYAGGGTPTFEDMVGHIANEHQARATEIADALLHPTLNEVQQIERFTQRFGNAQLYYDARERFRLERMPLPAPVYDSLKRTLAAQRNLSVYRDALGGASESDVLDAMSKWVYSELQRAIHTDKRPAEVVADEIAQGLIKHTLAQNAGISANAELLDKVSMRAYFEQMGDAEVFADTIRQARAELGVEPEEKDAMLLLGELMGSIRRGYQALSYSEQAVGFSLKDFLSDVINYHYHLIDAEARRAMERGHFLERPTEPHEIVNTRAPFSLPRRRRMQYALVDARYAFGKEGERQVMPYGKAFRAVDDEVAKAFGVDSAHALLSKSDGTLRELFGIRLPGRTTAAGAPLVGRELEQALLDEGIYFTPRMSEDTVEIGGKDYYVMEIPFRETPLTVLNRAYRSGGLRMDRIPKTGIADLEKDYFEASPHVVKSERGEPFFNEDSGHVFSMRQRLGRRAVIKSRFIHDAMANPLYGHPGLQSSPETFELDVADFLGMEPEAVETVEHVRKNYLLAHAGGGYFFVVRRSKPLATVRAVDKVLRMDEALKYGDMVHVDFKGLDRIEHVRFNDTTGRLLPDNRLSDAVLERTMDFNEIETVLNHSESSRYMRLGAIRALRMRTAAVADREVADILAYAETAYSGELNRYKDIWDFFRKTRLSYLRTVDTGTGSPKYTRLEAWKMALDETEERFGKKTVHSLGSVVTAGLEWFTNTWSRMTLSGYPSSRIRDVLGNFNSAAIGGFSVFNADDAQSLAEMHGILAGRALDVEIGATRYDSTTLMRWMRQFGVVDAGFTGSDLWNDDLMRLWLEDDAAIRKFDTGAYVHKTLFGSEKVGDEWRYIGMDPGTAMLYRNVLVPAVLGGAAAGAFSVEEEPSRRLGDIGKGALLGVGLGVTYAASRFAFGRSGNRFSLGLVDMRGKIPAMLEAYRGKESGFGYLTRRLGSAGENIQKGAYFLSMLKRGFSPQDAALKVHEVFLTPASLPTGMLRIRKMVPFFRWTAYNLPMQFKGLVERPRVAIWTMKAMRSLSSNMDRPDGRYIPQWILDQPHVFLGRNGRTGGYEYYVLGNWIPTADLPMILDPKNVGKNLLGMLTPALLVGIENNANRSFYFERALDSLRRSGTPGVSDGLFNLFTGGGVQVDRFLGVNMTRFGSHILRTVRVLTEIERISKGNTFEFLESAADHTERLRREKKLQMEDSRSVLTLTLSSGLGVLPRSYDIRLDRNKRIVVRRAKAQMEQMKGAMRNAQNAESPSARRIQMRRSLKIGRQNVEGFLTTPLDLMTPGQRKSYERSQRKFIERLERQGRRKEPKKEATP